MVVTMSEDHLTPSANPPVDVTSWTQATDPRDWWHAAANRKIERGCIDFHADVGLQFGQILLQQIAAESLRKLGCDQLQGYLFSKPLPVADYERMVQDDVRLPLT